VPSRSTREQTLSHVWSSEVHTAFTDFNISVNHYQKIQEKLSSLLRFGYGK